VCVRVRVCMRGFVRVCEYSCMHARVRARESVDVCAFAGARVRACECVCARARVRVCVYKTGVTTLFSGVR
jgi:hypothetical protein